MSTHPGFEGIYRVDENGYITHSACDDCITMTPVAQLMDVSPGEVNNHMVCPNCRAPYLQRMVFEQERIIERARGKIIDAEQRIERLRRDIALLPPKGG